MILLLDRNIRLNWRGAGSAYFHGVAPPLLELAEAPEARAPKRRCRFRDGSREERSGRRSQVAPVKAQPGARERPAGAAEDTGAGAVLDLLADCVASGEPPHERNDRAVGEGANLGTLPDGSAHRRRCTRGGHHAPRVRIDARGV